MKALNTPSQITPELADRIQAEVEKQINLRIDKVAAAVAQRQSLSPAAEKLSDAVKELSDKLNRWTFSDLFANRRRQGVSDTPTSDGRQN